MAGAPASMLSVGAVTRIGPRYAVKTQLRILHMRPKSTCKFRVGPQNPHQIPLFAPKTILPISIRHLQTKILCPPLLAMSGTNWGSSSLEWLKRNFFEPVSASFVVKFAEVFAKVALLFQVFAEFLKKNFFEPASANFVVKFADVVAKVALLFQVFAEFLKKNFFMPVSANFGVKFADVVAKLAFLFLAFLFLVFVNLEWIKKELVRMRDILKVVESKQNTVEGVGKWVEDVRDLSYQVDDVIDYIDIYFHTMKRRRPGVEGHMERFISQLKTPIIVAWQMLIIYLKYLVFIRLREIFGTIRDIGDEKRREAKSSSASSPQEHWQFYSHVKEAEVVGQKEEINYLREQVISEEPKGRRVISIVGMAGSGKTTLAKKVYEHDDVEKHFECRAFITLSQHYNIKDVLMSITKCVMLLSPEEIEGLTEEELGKNLRDHLKKKRYLVVIDDIWSKEAWDEMLEPILPDVENKSRVMLSTRNEKVLPDDPTLRMRPLNSNEAWELFMKKIFAGKYPLTADLTESEEETLTQILVKCGYLPLAILALGGLLASKEKTITVWSNVLESATSLLTDRSNKCGGILALCYSDLPPYLKKCFLYFGLFPEDYEIYSDKLIRLWIAEGFIEQRDNKILEDIAADYLTELVARSMIRASSKRFDGSIATCRIHDLFLDLSISIAKQDNFFTIHSDDGTPLPDKMWRLALHHSIDGYHLPKTLRSILCFGSGRDSNLEFMQAKSLRVVSQDFMIISKAALCKASSKKLKEFVHLRYLEREAAEGLLPSIGDLNNLQTLVLKQLFGSLPLDISSLEQLRHLDCSSHEVGNLQVNKLTNLQTLCLLAMDPKIKDGFGNLTNLRRLRIVKLRNLRVLELNCFGHLPQLKPFTCHFHLYKMSLSGRMQKLPELPPNLVDLGLSRSNLKQDAICMIEKLPHLKILRLITSYDSQKMICSSGGFPQLEVLIMHEIPLEEWIIEEEAMPSLKIVKLSYMPNLETQTLPKRVRDLLKRESVYFP